MYVGRDMTELSMMKKSDWENSELAYFHHSLQQMVPYLNQEPIILMERKPVTNDFIRILL